jgi:hypothetical protein
MVLLAGSAIGTFYQRAEPEPHYFLVGPISYADPAPNCSGTDIDFQN